MKYLSFIRHSEKLRETAPPPALMAAMGEFVQRSLRDGTLVETGGLLPSKDGLRVRLAGGKINVTDGPFTESKEVIGGWAILNASSKAEAVPEWWRSSSIPTNCFPSRSGSRPTRGAPPGPPRSISTTVRL